ncbi:hypothetical protein [Marinomonas sp.]|uniref:hypothetical protein n=1 Tax=Marinomonas sp. TaxID=1904862 RepID=UPI003BAAF1C2
MAYIIEKHNQIKINQIRKFLRRGNGFSTTFSRNGNIEQRLNAYWKNDHLIFEWFKEGKKLTQETYLAKSKTNFGSDRLWWKCPKCSRKCGALFDYGGVWWCRVCGNLKYQTESSNKNERVWPKVDRLLDKCQYREYLTRIDTLEDCNKPKWMRWKTWEPLKKRHNQLIGDAFDRIMKITKR